MDSLPEDRAARTLLAQVFSRNGYVRQPDPKRHREEGHTKYKKGFEVRLVAKTPAEAYAIDQALVGLGFKFGRPFLKARQITLPLYGKEQVSLFLHMMAQEGVVTIETTPSETLPPPHEAQEPGERV